MIGVNKTITITAPNNKQKKWKLTFGGGSPLYRTNPTVIYKRVEKRLLASQFKSKTSVKVNYGQGYCNESETSDNFRYLLYTLACFLEDYLSADLLKKKYRKYQS